MLGVRLPPLTEQHVSHGLQSRLVGPSRLLSPAHRRNQQYLLLLHHPHGATGGGTRDLPDRSDVEPGYRGLGYTLSVREVPGIMAGGGGAPDSNWPAF